MAFSIIKLHEQSAVRLAWVGGEAKNEISKGEQEEREVEWSRERASFTQWTQPEATSEGVSQVVGGDTGEEQEKEF